MRYPQVPKPAPIKQIEEQNNNQNQQNNNSSIQSTQIQTSQTIESTDKIMIPQKKVEIWSNKTEDLMKKRIKFQKNNRQSYVDDSLKDIENINILYQQQQALQNVSPLKQDTRLSLPSISDNNRSQIGVNSVRQRKQIKSNQQLFTPLKSTKNSNGKESVSFSIHYTKSNRDQSTSRKKERKSFNINLKNKSLHEESYLQFNQTQNYFVQPELNMFKSQAPDNYILNDLQQDQESKSQQNLENNNGIQNKQKKSLVVNKSLIKGKSKKEDNKNQKHSQSVIQVKSENIQPQLSQEVGQQVIISRFKQEVTKQSLFNLIYKNKITPKLMDFLLGHFQFQNQEQRRNSMNFQYSNIICLQCQFFENFALKLQTTKFTENYNPYKMLQMMMTQYNNGHGVKDAEGIMIPVYDQHNESFELYMIEPENKIIKHFDFHERNIKKPQESQSDRLPQPQNQNKSQQSPQKSQSKSLIKKPVNNSNNNNSNNNKSPLKKRSSMIVQQNQQNDNSIDTLNQHSEIDFKANEEFEQMKNQTIESIRYIFEIKSNENKAEMFQQEWVIQKVNDCPKSEKYKMSGLIMTHLIKEFMSGKVNYAQSAKKIFINIKVDIINILKLYSDEIQ